MIHAKNRILAQNKNKVYPIYDLAVRLAWTGLRFLGLFLPKIKLFTTGRRSVFRHLEQHIQKGDRIIWMHCASLGEFEQGLPVIEKLKTSYPNHKTLITFFSPSGYEVKKNSAAADIVTYLPMDTYRNTMRFLDIVQPEVALFVKYEIWPNYLRSLQLRGIPVVLFSAIFKPNQVFFKYYGLFMRNALKAFCQIFVQDEHSQRLLTSVGIENVVITGDTRLDRVSEIVERDNTLGFMAAFRQDSLCFVAGSTWPEDEAILVDYINNSSASLKFVLAPHAIKGEKIERLARSIQKKTILFSGISNADPTSFDVLILDTIGLLTKVYSYADIAYVGGGFATGLHNTLEPAVFGIPVLIGPHYKGFKEVEDLVALEGVLPLSSISEFSTLMHRLLNNREFRNKTGGHNASYVMANKGASIKIVSFVRSLIQK